MVLQLTQHFSLAEFTVSDTAARRGWDNQPPADILERMRLVTAPGMEKVRAYLGKPVLITSGFRCAKLNTAIGSKSTSDHPWGWCVDFISPGAGSPLTVSKRLADSGIEFDQLIHEFGEWTHISFNPKMRGQLLTIDSHGTRTGILPIRP